MELKLLTSSEWLLEQRRLISFAGSFGDKRLTVSTIHALRHLDGSLLEKSVKEDYEAVIAVAMQNKRVVGFGFAADGGEGGCMVVVHPEARSLGIGGAIVGAMIERLGKLTCNVATDNTASIALCFRLGMTAVSMHQGPTGKPTLRFVRENAHNLFHPKQSDLVSK